MHLNLPKNTRETRDPCKLAFTKELLRIDQIDYGKFLVISPDTPVYKCLNDYLNQFRETRLEMELTLHPMRDTANNGKYYLILHRAGLYLVETNQFKDKMERKWTGEDGAENVDIYYYTSPILDIPLLIDQ